MTERMITALDLADHEEEAIYLLPHDAKHDKLVLPDGHEFLIERAELHAATAPEAEQSRAAA